MRSDAEVVFAVCLGGLFLLMLIITIVFLFFSYFRMSEILEGLSNSEFLRLRKSFMGSDPVSRMFIVISVASVLAFHSRALKSGGLDSSDYKNFPADLKRQIKVTYWLCLIVGGMLFVVVGFGKWMGWVK